MLGVSPAPLAQLLLPPESGFAGSRASLRGRRAGRGETGGAGRAAEFKRRQAAGSWLRAPGRAMAGTASPRPLRGQSFYLDLPSGRGARDLAEAIGRLGGVSAGRGPEGGGETPGLGMPWQCVCGGVS